MTLLNLFLHTCIYILSDYININQYLSNQALTYFEANLKKYFSF